MFTIISPSKTQSTETRVFSKYSEPSFPDKSQHLLDQLRQHDTKSLARLMKISDKLAEENYTRFQSISFPLDSQQAKQSLFVFQGDVFNGIDAENYTEEELDFAQSHLGILSGLYGLLRPLDLMMPYRLEMGLKYEVNGASLYEFWRDELTELVNDLSNNMEILNLASNEYFKVLNKKKLNSPIITPQFKEQTDKGLKTVVIYAKQARGKMVNHIIKKKLTRSDQLLDYREDGYRYSPEHSKKNELLYLRKKS